MIYADNNSWGRRCGGLIAGLLFIAFAMALTMGCNEQDLETNAYKTLKVSAISYDAAMKSAMDLYTDGYISKKQLNGVFNVATKYRVSYLSCVSMLSAYHKIKTPTASDQERIKQTIKVCTDALADLTQIVSSYESKHPHGAKKTIFKEEVANARS